MPLTVSAEISISDVLKSVVSQGLVNEIVVGLQEMGTVVIDDDCGYTIQTVSDAISFLSDNGLPDDLVKLLVDWSLEPVADTAALHRWEQGVGKFW